MKKIIKIHCLHRSGSTFLTKFYKRLSELSGIKYYQTTGIKGIFNINTFLKSKESFCLCPIRVFPFSNKRISQLSENSYIENEINKDFQYIIQLRDPRDILVSQYYSFGWTHGYRKQKINEHIYEKKIERRRLIRNMSIDEYVLSDIGYKDLLVRYKPILYLQKFNNIKILKYSEMVLNFKVWSKKASKHFTNDPRIQDIIYKSFCGEFKNIKETHPQTFMKNKPLNKSCGKNEKRKVYPGDYNEKLSPKTINILNNKFKSILGFLNTI